MLHRQFFSVILTDQSRRLRIFNPCSEWTFKTKMSPSAVKPHDTGIPAAAARLILCKIIFRRRSSSSPLQTKQHRFHKRMKRRLSKLIFTADDLYSIPKIKMFLRQFSEIFNIKFSDYHFLYPLFPVKSASTPSQSAQYSTLPSSQPANFSIYLPRRVSLFSA